VEQRLDVKFVNANVNPQGKSFVHHHHQCVAQPVPARMSSAQQQRITEAEQRKYWEIFTALNPVNGYLTGFQAKAVLENSELDNRQLEAIWDLADVDNGTVPLTKSLTTDGNLDFEEFCVAMRLIFDVINGVIVFMKQLLTTDLSGCSQDTSGLSCSLL
jgi:Cytoskeletal-regulatory complex EF hand